MAVLERKSCPNCKVITKKMHCNSPHCGWWVCIRCSQGAFKFLVFDGRKPRHFYSSSESLF